MKQNDTDYDPPQKPCTPACFWGSTPFICDFAHLAGWFVNVTLSFLTHVFM
ncbi:hypothetical protein VCRA2122O10_10056 [Vibrio crassostreae]|nr:hypothetical protein VCRA2110O4_10328 [Vibrio crassostreae]CAK2696725.1 hypothetical protein VCRA2122O10_10056 [Vibrio crassostreae]